MGGGLVDVAVCVLSPPHFDILLRFLPLQILSPLLNGEVVEGLKIIWTQFCCSEACIAGSCLTNACLGFLFKEIHRTMFFKTLCLYDRTRRISHGV